MGGEWTTPRPSRQGARMFSTTTSRRRWFAACALPATAIAFNLAPDAAAQPPSVAIVAASGSATGGCYVTDPQSRLQATGLFSTVEFFNLQTGTPTLAQLQAWDAVLV